MLGARTGLGVDPSLVFPQSVLAIIHNTTQVCVVAVEVPRVCSGCEAELSLCSMAVTASAVWPASQLLECKP